MIKVVEAVTDLYGTCIHMLWRVPDWRMSVDPCRHALAKRTCDTAQLRADTRTQITVRSWRPGSASARVDNSAWARHQCCCLTSFRQQEICFRKQASLEHRVIPVFPSRLAVRPAYRSRIDHPPRGRGAALPVAARLKV